jgi:hypothetical protein
VSPQLAAHWIERTRNIRGWLWPAAAHLLAWLDEIQKRAAISGDIFEIGCFHGRSAVLLAAMLADRERLGVCDPFALHDPTFPAYLDDFRANMTALHGPCPNLDVHPITSQLLTPAHTGRNVRLFHVDGGHDAETVLVDLDSAAAATRDDGLVVMDDALNFAWPGVTEAVVRYLDRTAAFAPLLLAFNKLVMCRPAWHAHYQAWLRNEADCWGNIPRGPLTRKTLPFCGFEVDVLYAPARRNPDWVRNLLAGVHQHRPVLAERLARWTGYRRSLPASV